MTAEEVSKFTGKTDSYIRNLFLDQNVPTDFTPEQLIKALIKNIEIVDSAFINVKIINAELKKENTEMKRKLEALRSTINFEIDGICKTQEPVYKISYV